MPSSTNITKMNITTEDQSKPQVKETPSTSSTATTGFSISIFMKDNTHYQRYFYRMYLFLRYFLSLCMFTSSILKMPTYYEMINMALEIYYFKQEKSKNPDNEPGGDEQSNSSLQFILDIAFVYIGFFLIILFQFIISFKILCKKYRQLLPFLSVFLFYLVFILTAYFTDPKNSTMPLALALFMAKYSLFGAFGNKPERSWHLVLTRDSIFLDLTLLPVLIIFYFMVTRYKDYTVNGKTLMNRVYNLVETV